MMATAPAGDAAGEPSPARLPHRDHEVAAESHAQLAAGLPDGRCWRCFRSLKPENPQMEKTMTPDEAREHIAKSLKSEHDHLFQIIEALQAKGEDTSKLQTLAGRVRWTLQATAKVNE
jgi:hypothetical protein